MAKPTCKSESRWKYWREENPKASKDKFSRWAKKMMARARRRFLKLITADDYLTYNRDWKALSKKWMRPAAMKAAHAEPKIIPGPDAWIA